MRQKDFEAFYNKFNSSGKFIMSDRRYVFFSPALFLFCLGIAVVLMPKFFLYFIAAFFITLGTLTFFLVWKFLQLKNKFDKLSKEFKGQIIVQGIRSEGAKSDNMRTDPKSGLQNIRTLKTGLRQTNLLEEPLAGEFDLTDITTSKESKKIIFH